MYHSFLSARQPDVSTEKKPIVLRAFIPLNLVLGLDTLPAKLKPGIPSFETSLIILHKTADITQ